MLQELTANTGAGLFAIGSTLFFLIIFAGIALRVLTRRAGTYDATARLPLDDDPPPRGDEGLVTQTESQAGGR